jgi:hypothetical protein
MRFFVLHFWFVVGGVTVLTCAPTSAQADNNSPAYSCLVSEFPCPDPHVFYDGSDWYVFGTGARPFFLQGKEFGEGKMKKVFLELDYSEYQLKVAQIWGFIVHRHADGTYHGATVSALMISAIFCNRKNPDGLTSVAALLSVQDWEASC